MPTNTPVRAARRAGRARWPACSSASQATSSSRRCCGSMLAPRAARCRRTAGRSRRRPVEEAAPARVHLAGRVGIGIVVGVDVPALRRAPRVIASRAVAQQLQNAPDVVRAAGKRQPMPTIAIGSCARRSQRLEPAPAARRRAAPAASASSWLIRLEEVAHRSRSAGVQLCCEQPLDLVVRQLLDPPRMASPRRSADRGRDAFAELRTERCTRRGSSDERLERRDGRTAASPAGPRQAERSAEAVAQLDRHQRIEAELAERLPRIDRRRGSSPSTRATCSRTWREQQLAAPRGRARRRAESRAWRPRLCRSRCTGAHRGTAPPQAAKRTWRRPDAAANESSPVDRQHAHLRRGRRHAATRAARAPRRA